MFKRRIIFSKEKTKLNRNGTRLFLKSAFGPERNLEKAPVHIFFIYPVLDNLYNLTKKCVESN